MRTERRERPTLVDVAHASRVSRQTVSNALNYPERVAPQTLERVLLEIDRLGFRPNRAARSLRRLRAGAIGLQVEPESTRGFGNLSDPFLAALTSAAQAVDAHLITFVPPEDGDDASIFTTYQHLLETQVVDAFVLTHTRHQDPRASWLRDHEVPYVSFGRIWDEPRITSWVDVDGYAGTVEAVRHVRDRGYRRVAYLGWPDGSPVGDDRRAGWLASTGDLRHEQSPEGDRERTPAHELAPDQELEPAAGAYRLSAHAPQEPLAAAEAADTLLDRLQPGDAIVCVSDALALGASLAVARRGLRAGADIGIVGFDDGDLAAAFDLTTVRQPLAEIAAELVGLIERPTAPPEGVIVSPAVVSRGSTER